MPLTILYGSQTGNAQAREDCSAIRCAMHHNDAPARGGSKACTPRRSHERIERRPMHSRRPDCPAGCGRTLRARGAHPLHSSQGHADGCLPSAAAAHGAGDRIHRGDGWAGKTPPPPYCLTLLPPLPLVSPWHAMHLQGDQPDNMRTFWRFLLRKSLAPGSLAGVSYAVFGLGDSGYIQYNVSNAGCGAYCKVSARGASAAAPAHACSRPPGSEMPAAPALLQVAAKKLDRRLAGLGAAPVIDRGLGDDQVGAPLHVRGGQQMYAGPTASSATLHGSAGWPAMASGCDPACCSTPAATRRRSTPGWTGCGRHCARCSPCQPAGQRWGGSCTLAWHVASQGGMMAHGGMHGAIRTLLCHILPPGSAHYQSRSMPCRMRCSPA